MTDAAIRFLRIKRFENEPLVLQNIGDLDLVVFDEKEFIKYACAGHLEPYGFADVEAEDIVNDTSRLTFYTDLEHDNAREKLSRLIKFSHMVVPPEAFKTQCIGSFNYLWAIATREENGFD